MAMRNPWCPVPSKSHGESWKYHGALWKPHGVPWCTGSHPWCAMENLWCPMESPWCSMENPRDTMEYFCKGSNKIEQRPWCYQILLSLIIMIIPTQEYPGGAGVGGGWGEGVSVKFRFYSRLGKKIMTLCTIILSYAFKMKWDYLSTSYLGKKYRKRGRYELIQVTCAEKS